MNVGVHFHAGRKIAGIDDVVDLAVQPPLSDVPQGGRENLAVKVGDVGPADPSVPIEITNVIRGDLP